MAKKKATKKAAKKPAGREVTIPAGAPPVIPPPTPANSAIVAYDQADPETQRQIDELLAKARDRQQVVAPQIEKKGIQFIFGDSTPKRADGEHVQVINHFGRSAGGTIVEKVLDDVYRVKLRDDLTILVHEAEAVWYDT